jgi:hypothetical protein
MLKYNNWLNYKVAYATKWKYKWLNTNGNTTSLKYKWLNNKAWMQKAIQQGSNISGQIQQGISISN